MAQKPSTRAVHAGETRRKPYGAVTTPIIQTSTYTFADTAEIIDFMQAKADGQSSVRDEYGRYSNPTQTAAEGKMAVLEGGEQALLFASGMSAITTIFSTLLSKGDHLLLVSGCYHRTCEFTTAFLSRWGIETSVVPIDDPRAWETAIRPTTRMIFAESPTNPYLRVIDLDRLAAFAQSRKVTTVVDSTFATPINLRPLEHGIDLVIHSASKYLGGHNDLLAGVVVGSRGKLTDIQAARGILGGVGNPNDAYLLIRGLKTLDLRVHHQNQSGLQIAIFLESHPAVSRVHYPGLESHPDHAIACRQMTGFGGVVSFEVQGGFDETGQVIDRLQIPYIGPTLGGVESIVQQPAALFSLDPDVRRISGLKDNLVRYALGIEAPEDLIADLVQALEVNKEALMIVHKFGGTSVGSPERIARVADILAKYHAAQLETDRPGTVVLVSAMRGGVTDQLIQSARAAARGEDTLYREIKANLLRRHLEAVEVLLSPGTPRLEVGGYIEDKLNQLERFLRSIAMLGELTARGSDAVVSFGEMLSSTLLAALLRQRGLSSEAVSATRLIVTDEQFGEAGVLYPATRENLQSTLSPLVARGVIPVVTGFIGATRKGVTTTLGRGGSDFSAAIIGAGIDADEVWIWSDVDGILTADPNIVPQAHTLEELSYQEAAELAYYGAEVLHPNTIRPVIENNIPLRILNSFNADHPGTLIVDTPGKDRKISPAIISTTGLSMIAVSSWDDSWSLALAAHILTTLSKEGVQVLMFSQSFFEHSLNLIIRSQDQSHCLRVLNREFGGDRSLEKCKIDLREQIGTVSVVGLSNGKSNGAVSHAYAALGKGGTQVIAVAQPATECSVSFCIPEEQVPDTVRLLHTELGLED